MITIGWFFKSSLQYYIFSVVFIIILHSFSLEILKKTNPNFLGIDNQKTMIFIMAWPFLSIIVYFNFVSGLICCCLINFVEMHVYVIMIYINYKSFIVSHLILMAILLFYYMIIIFLRIVVRLFYTLFDAGFFVYFFLVCICCWSIYLYLKMNCRLRFP